MDSIAYFNSNVNICTECGEKVYDHEAFVYIETHGLPEPPYEKFYLCPHCRGGLAPATECEECGEIFKVEELIGGCCRECFEKEAYGDGEL